MVIEEKFSEEEYDARYIGDFLSLEEKFDLMLYVLVHGYTDLPDGYTEPAIVRNPDNTQVYAIWYKPIKDPEHVDTFSTNIGFETEDGEAVVEAIERWQKSGRPIASFQLKGGKAFDLWLPPVKDLEQFARIQASIIEATNALKKYYIERKAAQIAASIAENVHRPTRHAS